MTHPSIEDLRKLRGAEVVDGALEVLVALKLIDLEYRLDSLAIAVDAWVRTNGTLEMKS